MKLSIVTVTYNNKEGFIKTYNSIIKLLNNKTDVEWIVIDGGSIDFWNYCPKNSENFKIISESDKGIYDAMNKGISNSSGKNILFLNAGDILEGNLSLLLDGDPVYFTTLVNHNKRKKRMFLPRILGLPSSHQAILFKNNGNFYDLNYKICSDYEYFLRNNFKFNKISGLNAVVDDNGISSKFKLEQIYECYSIQKKYFYITPEIFFILKILKYYFFMRKK
jgi:putative colanic acid biosynthesis glycosyltransferase